MNVVIELVWLLPIFGLETIGNALVVNIRMIWTGQILRGCLNDVVA